MLIKRMVNSHTAVPNKNTMTPTMVIKMKNDIQQSPQSHSLSFENSGSKKLFSSSFGFSNTHKKDSEYLMIIRANKNIIPKDVYSWHILYKTSKNVESE